MHNATTVADRATPSLDHVCPTRKPPQPWLRHATPSLPRQLRLHAAVAADHSQRSHRDLRCAPHTATTVAVSFSALTATTMADLHHTTSWPLAQCPARALDATTVAESRTGWPQRHRRARRPPPRWDRSGRWSRLFQGHHRPRHAVATRNGNIGSVLGGLVLRTIALRTPGDA